MGRAALLTALLIYPSRFLESRAGSVVYLLVTAIAVLFWLVFQLRIWFGWPTSDQDKGPITLGLNDHKKRN
jgi:hypothetical protein